MARCGVGADFLERKYGSNPRVGRGRRNVKTPTPPRRRVEWSILFDEHRMLHSVSGWSGVVENYEKRLPHSCADR